MLHIYAIVSTVAIITLLGTGTWFQILKGRADRIRAAARHNHESELSQ